MLELLLGSGTKGDVGQIFPNSGPGNKVLLKGSKDLGYFGEIPASQLFDGGELADATGFNTAGNPVAGVFNGLSWFKFVYKGKYLFVAKQVILTSVTWNQIYNAGLVYGLRGNGSYPTAAPTDQLNPVNKTEDGKTWYLTPRLMQMLNADPFSVTTTTAVTTNNSEMTGDEWDDLMSKILVTAAGGDGSLWASNTAAQVLTSFSWGKETQSSNVNNNVYRPGALSSAAGGAGYPKSAVTSTAGWRPVLELVANPGSVAIKPTGVYGDAKGSEPYSPDLKNQVFVNPSRRVNTVVGTYDAIKSPDVKAKLSNPALAVAQPGSSTTTLKPFSVKASYVA